MTAVDSPSLRLLSAVAVVRHAERADAVLGHPWNSSADAASFPFDPPITAAGAQMAAQRANELTLSGFSFKIVVSSPYLRAVQTALVFAEHFDAIVILDYQLGEVFGPHVFGDDGPDALPWRTCKTLLFALESCDEVPVDLWRLQREHLFGEPPMWPETIVAARMRYATRYLTYLRRGRQARINCLLVTHGHMVQASLRVLPATSLLMVDSVDYCATVVAQVYKRDVQVSCSAIVDGDLEQVVDGLAGRLDGGELGPAEALNDAALQDTTLSWWEASIHGVIYQGDEVNKGISNSTEQHRRFLAKLQHHLDWSWNRVECLLGSLRRLQEIPRPLSEGIQKLALPSSPTSPTSTWNPILSSRSSADSGFDRFVSGRSSADSGFDRFISQDSFCQLLSDPASPIHSPKLRKPGKDSPLIQDTQSLGSTPSEVSPARLTRPKSMQDELCMKRGPARPLMQGTQMLVPTPSEGSPQSATKPESNSDQTCIKRGPARSLIQDSGSLAATPSEAAPQSVTRPTSMRGFASRLSRGVSLLVATPSEAPPPSVRRPELISEDFCMKRGSESRLIQGARSLLATPSSEDSPPNVARAQTAADEICMKRGTEGPLIRSSCSLPRLATPKRDNPPEGIRSLTTLNLNESGLAKRRQSTEISTVQQKLSV